MCATAEDQTYVQTLYCFVASYKLWPTEKKYGGFLLQEGRGCHPQITFASLKPCSPLKVSKKQKKEYRNNSLFV